MQAEQIMKVILYRDGATYILLNKNASVVCTAESLSALLEDPIAFYVEGYKNYLKPSKSVFPDNVKIFLVPGLTMLYVTKDNRVVCDFPEIYTALFAAMKNKETNKPIVMKNYLKKTQFSTEKSYIIRFYLENIASYSSKVNLLFPLELSLEHNNKYLQEIMQTNLSLFTSQLNPNVSFSERGPKTVPTAEFQEEINAMLIQDITKMKLMDESQRYKLTSEHVLLSRYCQIHNVNRNTVASKVNKGCFKSAVQDEDGKWYVHRDEIPADGRAGRKAQPKDETGKKYITAKKDSSYEEVQEYIKGRKLVSDSTRPYIRTVAEALFYAKQSYHEVKWINEEDGSIMLGMIVDINPGYFSKKYQKTNRELIQEGKSPVVENNEDEHWHLHHIGQRPDSPLAILRSGIHNSSEYYSTFHLTKSSDINLHGPEFEKKKKAFWLRYLEEYDKVGRFIKIPYENPVSKRRK